MASCSRSLPLSSSTSPGLPPRPLEGQAIPKGKRPRGAESGCGAESGRRGVRVGGRGLGRWRGPGGGRGLGRRRGPDRVRVQEGRVVQSRAESGRGVGSEEVGIGKGGGVQEGSRVRERVQNPYISPPTSSLPPHPMSLPRLSRPTSPVPPTSSDFPFNPPASHYIF